MKIHIGIGTNSPRWEAVLATVTSGAPWHENGTAWQPQQLVQLVEQRLELSPHWQLFSDPRMVAGVLLWHFGVSTTGTVGNLAACAEQLATSGVVAKIMQHVPTQLADFFTLKLEPLPKSATVTEYVHKDTAFASALPLLQSMGYLSDRAHLAWSTVTTNAPFSYFDNRSNKQVVVSGTQAAAMVHEHLLQLRHALSSDYFDPQFAALMVLLYLLDGVSDTSLVMTEKKMNSFSIHVAQLRLLLPKLSMFSWTDLPRAPVTVLPIKLSPLSSPVAAEPPITVITKHTQLEYMQ